jgi:hypothetical protein
MSPVETLDQPNEIPSLGELFPDGTALDRLRHNQLVLWREGREEIAPSHRYHGNSYVVAALDPKLEELLRLPAATQDFGSVESLIADLSQLISSSVELDEEAVWLVASFILSTWVADCLPSSPCLNVWGPTGSETALVELLASVCRQPLRVAEPSIRDLLSLPRGLALTLILKRPSEQAFLRLLAVATDPEVQLLRGGQVRNLRCATVVFTTEPIVGAALGIPLLPARGPYRRVGRSEAQQMADEFQPRLMRYRLVQHRRVTNSQFDLPGFAPESRMLARILGATLEESTDLQNRISGILQSIDEQTKGEQSLGLGAVVSEALLALCHENKPEAYVREISELANGILLGRHEIVELTPKAVGAMLRQKLGLWTERRGPGYRLLLTQDTRRRIHRLAAAHHVLSMLEPVPDCRLCLETRGPTVIREELQVHDVQQVHQVHDAGEK